VNAVVYEIAITVYHDVPVEDRDGLYMQIANQLLIPALSDLSGYHSVSFWFSLL